MASARAAHRPAPQPASPSSRAAAGAWWTVAVLSIAQLVAFVDRQIINLLVEPMKRDLGVSDVQISLLQGLAFGLAQALLVVPLGRLADTHNRRAIILAGVACWTVACAGSGLVSAFGLLFVFRMLISVGESTLTPSGYSMLADVVPRERLGRAISVFLGAGFAGSGLALVAGGWILARLHGIAELSLPLAGTVRTWQAAFLAASLPGLLCLALVATLREPERTGLSTRTAARPVPRFGDVLRFVFRQRRTIGAIYVGFALLAATQFALGAWVPSFFIRTHGWSAPEIGYAYGACYTVAGTGGVIAGGWLCDALSTRGHRDANLRTGVLAGLAALPFIIAFPLMNDGRAAFLLLVPATFFATMPFGAGTAALPLLAPNRMRGQVVALYLVVANLLGQGLGPTLVATLTDVLFRDPMQLRWSLPIASATLLIAAVAVIGSGLKPVSAALALEQDA